MVKAVIYYRPLLDVIKLYDFAIETTAYIMRKDMH